jgi:gamma-glutamylaminecyclotransferase
MKQKEETMQKVFVYGTLMTGFENHIYMSKSRLLGKAMTMKKFYMTARFIPFVSDVENEKSNYIIGEVYEVDSQSLNSIDRLEGHPDFYKRKEIDVRLDDGSTMKCWMYFSEGDEGHTEVESGNYYLYRFSTEKVRHVIKT